MTLPKYQSLFGEDHQSNPKFIINFLDKQNNLLDEIVLELVNLKSNFLIKSESTQRANGSINQRFAFVTEILTEFQLNFEKISDEIELFANQQILSKSISDSSVLILKNKLVSGNSTTEISNSVFSLLLEIKDLLQTRPQIVAYANVASAYSIACFEYNEFLNDHLNLFPLWKNYKIKNSEIAFNKLVSTQMGRRFGR